MIACHDVRRRVLRRREVALRKFGYGASSCRVAGESAWLPARRQPTPFVFSQDLLVQPDVVIFASSNLCVLFVSTTSRPAPPRPPVRGWAD